MRRMKAAGVIAMCVMTACGGAPDPAPAPPAPPANTSEPVREPAPDPRAAAITELTSIRNDACRCTDDGCSARVRDDYERFRARHGAAGEPSGEPDDPVDTLHAELSQCLGERLAGGGHAPAWTGTTGLPECDDFVRAMDAYLACDKVPQAARDGAREGLEALRAGWAEISQLPPEAKRATADGCLQAVEALRQSAAAMGCPM